MDSTHRPLSTPLTREVLRASWHHWLRMSEPYAGPRWLLLAWTGLFSAALAVVFTLISFVTTAQRSGDWMSLHSWVATYRANLVLTLVVGYAIQALFVIARRTLGLARIAALAGWRRKVFFTGIPVAGTALGIPLGALLLSGDASVLRQQTAAQVAGLVVMSLLMTVVIATWFALRNRQFGAEMRARDAQLQLLQGQMEPHFLFNTLANVISLIDADAPRAKQVLEAFTEYLRASLGGMRTGDSTLGAEIELATRFLGLMQARMGDRLRFEVVADPALRGARLPPLLLQPLVENAVRHGLEPLVEGGKVRVEVERVPGEGSPALRLCVEDDGTGLDGPARAAGRGGAGIALANLRARLHALYGAAASLQLAPGAGGRGTRACVIVPWRAADIADAGPATLLPTHHEP